MLYTWACPRRSIGTSLGLDRDENSYLGHRLRSMEQLTETGNSPAQQWPSNHSNLFGLANSTQYNFPSLAGRSNVTPASGLDGLNSWLINGLILAAVGLPHYPLHASVCFSHFFLIADLCVPFCKRYFCIVYCAQLIHLKFKTDIL